MTYNGWSNYETWNVALWLDNDEGSYRFVRELAQVARDEARDLFQSRPHCATTMLADSIEELVKNGAPELGASMYSDLLSAALSDVDWREIAEHIIGEDES